MSTSVLLAVTHRTACEAYLGVGPARGDGVAAVAAVRAAGVVAGVGRHLGLC